MHLDELRGHTLDEIVGDGFEVDATVSMSPETDTTAEMARGVGRGVAGFVDVFETVAPEAVLVLGDRTEAFAGAVAAALSGRCLAHLHGGERTRGGFDESMRHAITKLAHVHFAATEGSMERIIRMGEREENVYLVGAPGLDEALAGPFSDKEMLTGKLDVEFTKPVILVVQHPVSTRPEDAAIEMAETLEAGVAEDATVVVVYPNSDAGGRQMIEVIRSYENRPNVWTFPNIPRTDYLSLMKQASVLVGNSSGGIIEAPSFGLPVVNVGERQAGRERARNVIDVTPDRTGIRIAVRKCLHDKDFRESLQGMESPWGDGRASERIVEILEILEIDHDLLQKQIAY
jgi:UDP-hydrolysing UDP-N-acetyl-D-glucosamine 2-epimerase